MTQTRQSGLDNSRMALYSGHLTSVAGTVFGPEVTAGIERLFLRTLEFGGLSEEDFEREPGVSYNPRPARVALILIKDLKIKSAETISAGILAAVAPGCAAELIKELTKDLDNREKIAELAQAALLPLVQIEQLNQSLRADAAAISAAIFLDRMRHFHLTRAWRDSSDRSGWLKQVEPYIRFSSQTAPLLTPFFQTWCDRLERANFKTRPNN